jgi:3-oxoacyl-[acyl-carrier-protein] synthase-1
LTKQGIHRLSCIENNERQVSHPVTPPISPIQVKSYTATSAVGQGKAALLRAVQAHQSGLRPLGDHMIRNGGAPLGLKTWVGWVDGLEAPLPPPWEHWDCRNNRLAWIGLQGDGFLNDVRNARSRYGADRVALILGTSTSSIGATEKAYVDLSVSGNCPTPLSNPSLHTLHSLTGFVQEALEIHGPSYTLSTACSSSAKAFCAAERLLRLNLVDAVVVGGVDSLCGSVLYGFNALQLISPNPCTPFDIDRQGINLGEAAGFALLVRESGPLQLLGYGESSDAFHMSAPHPSGQGAETALHQALTRAALDRNAIDYIHLHGTATPKNDEIEALLFNRCFGTHTLASSTKGMTGHTLGAAGMLGAAFSLLALEYGWLPGTVNTQNLDPVCGPNILNKPLHNPVQVVASNSFAFGGSNCVLIWGQS